MSNKPNILMIVTDQEFAHQALPEGVVLPNRDRLQAAGVTFSNHQVTTTVCTPSRSVMWTGQHTPFTKMFDIGKSGDRVLGASFLNIRSVFYLP